MVSCSCSASMYNIDNAGASECDRRTVMLKTPAEIGEAAIWARIIESDQGGLRPEVAKSLLALRFGQKDQERMNKLARKNQKGHLTYAERRELEAYVNVGDVLALMHLNAQDSLGN